MVRRSAQLLVGLFFFGFACAMLVRARVGVDPWTVFAQGLSNVTGLTIGTLTVVIGVAVLLLWIPIRQRPGVGTILNILLIGPALDLGLWILPEPSHLWARIPLFSGGLVLLAVGTGLYIGADFGPGPRDGLMTGLHTRFGISIAVARTSIELTVLTVGWILGGDLGVGTVAFALLVGPLCGITLPMFDLRARHRAGQAGDRAAQQGL